MTEIEGLRGRLALVLGGGGSKGALQVGLYRALCELRVQPDLIVGASVGALNGALIAAGVGPRTVREGWTEMERSDLFRLNWSLLWRGLRAESLFSGSHFRNFLEDRLPADRFRDLPVPLHVVTTHLSLGSACTFNEGSLVEAILASCSVPGLLPPVQAHGGVAHVDGSLGNNLPISVARELGADRILAMSCRTCDRCGPTRFDLVEVMGRAFSIAADCARRRMTEDELGASDLLLLEPDLGERVYALDFSHGERLVRAGYEHTLPRVREWLAHLDRQPTRRPG